MSTQSLVSRRHGRKHLPAFSLFGGLLITWLAFSCTAFATPSPPDVSRGTQQNLIRAGVSVVRLLVKYDKPDTSATVYCTGLGIIIASRPAQNTSDQNNWVLTDSSLVNGNQALCANGNPLSTLTSIEVYLSSAYNPQEITFQGSVGSVICQVASCHSGPALFALGSNAQGQLLPSIDLAQQQSTQDMAVALAPSAAVTFPSSTDVQPPLPSPSITNSDSQNASAFQTQAEIFRAPHGALSSFTLEAGTPLINSNGQLTNLHLEHSSAQITNNDLKLFMQKNIPDFMSHPSNSVHDGWQHGMDAYTQGNFTTAHTDFLIAANANHNFQAAKDFASLPTHPGGNSGVGQLNATYTITIAGVTIPLWQAVIVIVVLLAAVLLVITLLLGKSRRILQADWDEADQQATIQASQIAQMEAAQRVKTQQSMYESPIQRNPILAPGQPLVAQLHCPDCGEMLPREANFCSNCSLLLSPSESGLHLRIQSQRGSGPAVSTRSLADQPTIPSPPLPASSLAEQPTIVPAPPSPPLPASSLAEQPTIDMSPNSVREQSTELEKTRPYMQKRQMNSTRFELAVGTRSDPGIKRKYKPNEDSLFAVQGMIDETPVTHPYGLFVIADGMGGHANGQDASRLAIQTIIEYILPRLLQHGSQSNENYAKLLVEGIQSANLAVHQRNMEQRGDMGTTVTGTLVVGNLAYVVNVGDSRTYLYRQADGLKKITNDHSVVASLVEAGIIKPDDIYTHPKRSHIYRSLGEKPAVEVDLFTVQLQEGDTLLLCSDGLWDMVRDPKIEDLIKQPAPHPLITSDALIQAAFDGGGEDNVSVIVVNIAESPVQVTSMPRIQLLAKPETVQMPQL